MRDELAARAAEEAGADSRQSRVAVVFESNPFMAAEIDALIGNAVQDEVSFIGVVSNFGTNTSLPLHMLLQAVDVPVHFFPSTLHPCLLRALRESSTIRVLGRGSDPRADLVAHLERAGQIDRQSMAERQAVA
jgi:hypothetical protein